MLVSVVVPAYNAEKNLPVLLDSLTSQSYKNFELIIVDDFSKDKTSLLLEGYNVNYIKQERNRGPAFCRNAGAQTAKGDVLAFTDSDCCADSEWLQNIYRNFSNNTCDALMGRLILEPSGFLGDSISALGFPAGGSIGFEKIWRVDSHGYTDSLSSCNCAIRREIFEGIGGFDIAFPYAGGEDSYLAYRLKNSGYKIRYCPDVVMHHEARDSLSGFLKWQFRRGISSYIFSKKVKEKEVFLKLRLWSVGNVIRDNLFSLKFPVVAILLCLSMVIQSAGFFYGRYREL